MRLITRVSCCALVLGLAGLAAMPLSAADEKEKKARDPAKMFSRRDVDGDGKLTFEEFTAGMKESALAKAEQRFKRIDADGDGAVTLKEIIEAMKKAAGKKGE